MSTKSGNVMYIVLSFLGNYQEVVIQSLQRMPIIIGANMRANMIIRSHLHRHIYPYTHAKGHLHAQDAHCLHLGTCTHTDVKWGPAAVSVQPLHPNLHAWDSLHVDAWNTCA